MEVAPTGIANWDDVPAYPGSYPQLGTVALRGLGVSFSPSGLEWQPRPG
jgi:hypothetical protein